jgi:hypothetical protein
MRESMARCWQRQKATIEPLWPQQVRQLTLGEFAPRSGCRSSRASSPRIVQSQSGRGLFRPGRGVLGHAGASLGDPAHLRPAGAEGHAGDVPHCAHWCTRGVGPRVSTSTGAPRKAVPEGRQGCTPGASGEQSYRRRGAAPHRASRGEPSGPSLGPSTDVRLMS